MSYEAQGFDLLVGRRSHVVGAIAVPSASTWAYAGVFTLGMVAVGMVVHHMRRPSEASYDETMERVAKILKRPRAVVETDADPEFIRLARKGMSAEALAYGIWDSARRARGRRLIRAGDADDESPKDMWSKTLTEMNEIDRLVSRAPMSERKRLISAWLVDHVGEHAARDFGWPKGAPLAPQYPNLHAYDAARIALGTSPKKLFEPAPIPPPDVHVGSADRVRAEYVNEQCQPDRDRVWQAMSDRDKTIVALRNFARYRIGQRPADAPNEERWYPDLASALAAVDERDREARKRHRGRRKSMMTRVREIAESPHYPSTYISEASTDLAKWEIATCKNPERATAFLKVREFAAGHGGRFFSNYAEEIEDHNNGELLPIKPSASPEAVYEALKQKKAQRGIQKFGDRLLYRRPTWWPEVEGIELIRRAPELLAEGTKMHHCLGDVQDAEMAIEGKRYYAHVTAPNGEEATIEFDGTGKVLQFQGPDNVRPGEAARDLMRRAVEKIGRESFDDF